MDNKPSATKADDGRATDAMGMYSVEVTEAPAGDALVDAGCSAPSASHPRTLRTLLTAQTQDLTIGDVRASQATIREVTSEANLIHQGSGSRRTLGASIVARLAYARTTSRMMTMTWASSATTSLVAVFGSLRKGRSSSHSGVQKECPGLQMQKDLWRGSPACAVLHGFGQLLGSSEGTTDTYNQSRDMDMDEKLACFLSHNWSVHRIPKFFVWAVHFNTKRAVIFAVANLVLMATLTALKWGPTTQSVYGTSGYLCWATTTPVFVLMVIFGHEIDYFLGKSRHMVFLDKTCIHQTELALKTRGIRHIGGFIYKSFDMVVCYSDEYLRKLWTVYELACFLTLHKYRHVIFIPTTFPLCMSILMFIGFTSFGAVRFVGDSPKGKWAVIVAFFVMWSLLGRLAILHFARKREEMVDAARKFEITEAKCRVLEDRNLIYDNITEMLHVKKWIDTKCQDKALDRFNKLVQDRVPENVDRCMGRVGLRWRWVFVFLLTSETPSALDICLAQLDEHSVRGNVFALAHTILKAGTIVPFWVALESMTVSACWRLSAGWKTLALIASFPVSVVLLFGLWLTSLTLSKLANDSNLAAVGFGFLHFFVSLGNMYAYRSWPHDAKTGFGLNGEDEISLDLDASDSDDQEKPDRDVDQATDLDDGSASLPERCSCRSDTDAQPDEIVERFLPKVHEEGAVQLPTEGECRISVDLSDVHEEHKVGPTISSFVMPPQASAGITNKIVQI